MAFRFVRAHGRHRRHHRQVRHAVHAAQPLLAVERRRRRPAVRAWARRRGRRATAPSSRTSIDGLCNQERFLQLLRDFIAFDEGADGLRQADREAAPVLRGDQGRRHAPSHAVETNGKAGVVWHTQGSGKSMEMELYANLVARHPKLKNPTIVVVTDRTELDGQLFEAFDRSACCSPRSPIQVTTRAQLRDELTNRATGGIYFTTLQKFGRTEEERESGARPPAAHRPAQHHRHRRRGAPQPLRRPRRLRPPPPRRAAERHAHRLHRHADLVRRPQHPRGVRRLHRHLRPHPRRRRRRHGAGVLRAAAHQGRTRRRCHRGGPRPRRRRSHRRPRRRRARARSRSPSRSSTPSTAHPRGSPRWPRTSSRTGRSGASAMRAVHRRPGQGDDRRRHPRDLRRPVRGDHRAASRLALRRPRQGRHQGRLLRLRVRHRRRRQARPPGGAEQGDQEAAQGRRRRARDRDRQGHDAHRLRRAAAAHPLPRPPAQGRPADADPRPGEPHLPRQGRRAARRLRAAGREPAARRWPSTPRPTRPTSRSGATSTRPSRSPGTSSPSSTSCAPGTTGGPSSTGDARSWIKAAVGLDQLPALTRDPRQPGRREGETSARPTGSASSPASSAAPGRSRPVADTSTTCARRRSSTKRSASGWRKFDAAGTARRAASRSPRRSSGCSRQLVADVDRHRARSSTSTRRPGCPSRRSRDLSPEFVAKAQQAREPAPGDRGAARRS